MGRIWWKLCDQVVPRGFCMQETWLSASLSELWEMIFNCNSCTQRICDWCLKWITRRCQRRFFFSSSRISVLHLIRRCVTPVETASLNNVSCCVAVKFKWMMPINMKSISSCSLDMSYWCFQVIVCFIRISYLSEVVGAVSAWMPRHHHCYF